MPASANNGLGNTQEPIEELMEKFEVRTNPACVSGQVLITVLQRGTPRARNAAPSANDNSSWDCLDERQNSSNAGLLSHVVVLSAQDSVATSAVRCCFAQLTVWVCAVLNENSLDALPT